MKRMLYIAMVALGVALVGCDKETAWEQQQERRIAQLEAITANQQMQIDAIQDQINSEIERLEQIIQAVNDNAVSRDVTLHHNVLHVQRQLEASIVQLAQADANNLVVALQAVAAAEESLIVLLESNVNEITAALEALNVTNVDIENSISNILTDLAALDAALNAEVVDLNAALAATNQLLNDANAAIAANTAAIASITPSSFEYSAATGVLSITYGDGRVFSTGDLRGAQGPQGIQGEIGAIGPQGERGPAGADGADGNNGLNGTSSSLDVTTTQTASGTQVVITVVNGTTSNETTFFIANGSSPAPITGTSTVTTIAIWTPGGTPTLQQVQTLPASETQAYFSGTTEAILSFTSTNATFSANGNIQGSTNHGQYLREYVGGALLYRYYGSALDGDWAALKSNYNGRYFAAYYNGDVIGIYQIELGGNGWVKFNLIESSVADISVWTPTLVLLNN